MAENETWLAVQEHSNSNPSDNATVYRWSEWIAWYRNDPMSRLPQRHGEFTYDEAVAEAARLNAEVSAAAVKAP